MATDVTKSELNENHELLTYDVKGLYVNIPIEDTLTITNSMLLKSNDAQTTQMLIILLKLILLTELFHFPKEDQLTRRSSIRGFTNGKHE